MLGVATAGALLSAVALSFAQSGGTPIVGSTVRDVDYHAEGQIIGGNISIQSDRAPNSGVAVATCDPDPRTAGAPRPDACAWREPAGPTAGRDLVNFGRHIPDADTSPNGAFAPAASATRENFNGKAGFDSALPAFTFDGHFFDDDDMHFRLTPRTLDAYLAPNGDANNRWRRFCGTGVVEQFNNSGPGGAPAHPPLAPFAAGQVRKFVVEIWDADWRDPSDNDGGNQDFWVIDILAPGSTFDVSQCQNPGGVAQPNPRPDNPTARNPTGLSGSLPPLAVGPAAPSLTFGSGLAGLGRRGCVRGPFTARVNGRGIRHVTFTVNGRRIARVTRPRNGVYSARISPVGRRVGQRIAARVVFRAAGSPPRTLRFRFRQCASQQRPAFTG